MNLKKFAFPFLVTISVISLGACDDLLDGTFGGIDSPIVTGNLTASPDDSGSTSNDLPPGDFDGSPPAPSPSTPPTAGSTPPGGSADDDDTPPPPPTPVDDVAGDPDHPALDDPTNQCNDNGKKVLVCQVPPGNPDNRHNICIAYPALQAHTKSGSYLGPCR